MSTPSNWVRFIAALSYGTISVTITLFNKAVFSTFNFNYPCAVITAQIAISLVLMHLLRLWKILSFPDFDIQVAKKVFPLTLCWWIYVVSGLTALRYLNVPMFGVLRRSTTAFVLLGEVALFRKWPSLDSVGAVALMIVGAMVAGFTDLTFSLPGYLYVFLCAISTAAYLLLIRLLKDKLQQSDAALLYYNNVVSLPIMISYMALATDELHHVIEYPQLRSHTFQLFMLASCSQALLLNLCIFRCTSLNSPLTTSVTGQLKDLLTTSLGFFLFGDVKYNTINIVGLTIGLSGGIWYSAIGYRSRLQTRTRKSMA